MKINKIKVMNKKLQITKKKNYQKIKFKKKNLNNK